MGEKFMALHPDEKKQGTNIDKAKYDRVRRAILDIIGEKGEIPFQDLPGAVSGRLVDFDGSIGWYTTTVKLDLEARRLIERIPKSSPQRLRLVQK